MRALAAFLSLLLVFPPASGNANPQDEPEFLDHPPALAPFEVGTEGGMVFRYISYSWPGLGTIDATGPITQDAPEALRRAIARADAGGRRISGISFDSTGGSLTAAIELGRVIREHSITTVVEEDKQCLSACAIAFLGGTTRRVNARSILNTRGSAANPTLVREQELLGFHAFFVPIAVSSSMEADEVLEFVDLNQKDSQRTLGDLAEYIAEMGVNPSIIEVSAAYGSDEMLFPSIELLETLDVILTGIEVRAVARLIPDGARTNAVLTQGTDRLLFGCAPTPEGRLTPRLVISSLRNRTSVPGDATLQGDTTLSDIVKSERIDWAPYTKPGEIGGGVFIGPWVPNWKGFQSIAAIHINHGATRPLLGEREEITLLPSNSQFFVDDQAIHIVLNLSSPLLIDVLSTESMAVQAFYLSWYPPLISVYAEGDDLGRENIRFALQACAQGAASPRNSP